MFVKSAVSNKITTAAHLKHQKNKENHAINHLCLFSCVFSEYMRLELTLPVLIFSPMLYFFFLRQWILCLMM